MSTCTLNWYPDRGFELDVDVTSDEVSLRMVGVPVPVDGTRELRAEGAELDRLDILFKAQVELDGEPGQLHEARVRVLHENGAEVLELDAKLEDVETGDIVPFKTTLPVEVPPAAPEAGGPRPRPTDEDELDWEDETTLEQMVVNAPETTGSREKPPAPKGGGLQALLKALADLDESEEGEGEGAEAAGEQEEPLAPVSLAQPPPSEAPPPEPEAPEPAGPEADQLMSAQEEARQLLQLLEQGEHLELEEDHDLEELVAAASEILQKPHDAETKAAQLGAWLLEQPAVADLFIADEDLAEILERW